MLSADLSHALDPVAWARDRLGLELDPVQSELISSRGRRELLCCTRQWGKTTTTAAAVLHECEYFPGSKVVIMGPSCRQSSLALAQISLLAAKAGIACDSLPGPDPGLQLPHGVVIALPGTESTTRGFAGVTWLVVDEAARVSNALFHSASAYLATTNGRVWLLSTPFGRRGFFFDEHEAGRYRVTRVAAVDCPRISAEFLAEQKLTMPLSWFRQEYGCEFTSLEDSVFAHDLVLASIGSDVEPLCL